MRQKAMAARSWARAAASPLPKKPKKRPLRQRFASPCARYHCVESFGQCLCEEPPDPSLCGSQQNPMSGLFWLLRYACEIMYVWQGQLAHRNVTLTRCVAPADTKAVQVMHLRLRKLCSACEKVNGMLNSKAQQDTASDSQLRRSGATLFAAKRTWLHSKKEGAAGDRGSSQVRLEAVFPCGMRHASANEKSL